MHLNCYETFDISKIKIQVFKGGYEEKWLKQFQLYTFFSANAKCRRREEKEIPQTQQYYEYEKSMWIPRQDSAFVDFTQMNRTMQ